MSLGQWDQHAENTVIIGGGVVGLSTAYYLALLQQSNASGHSAANSAICIVESSTKVGLGASGQATGNLGDSGFVSAAEELGSASFALHHELAYQNNGPTAYGYAPLTIWTASREASKPCSGTNDSPGQVRNPPRWLKRAPDWNFSVKTNQSHASHLDPHEFCEFLYEKCKELGVVFYLNADVEAVTPQSDMQAFKSISISRRGSTKPIGISCKSILISAGPWSQHVLEKLFPDSRYVLPLDSTNAAGNHLQIQNPHWPVGDDKSGVDQVFLGDIIGNNIKLDLTSCRGGSIYVGGYGAEPQALPESAESVRPQPSYIDAMRGLASTFLDLPAGETLEVLSTGRCYRPATLPNRPIIAKVPLHEVYPYPYTAPWQDKQPYRKSSERGGLFVSTGHNRDGLALAPGSGKVMAELILGMELSIDISRLGP